VLAYPPDVAHNQAKAGSQPCQYNDGGTPTPCTFGFSLCLPDDNWLTEGWDERATLFFQLHDTGATSQVPISTVLFNISTATAPGRFGFHFRWYRSDGVQGSASHYKTFAEWETYLGHSLFSNWIDIVVSGALDVIPPSSTSVRVWVNADAYTDTPVWQVNNAYWGAYYPQASRPSWGKHPFTKIGTYYWWTKQAGATYGIGDVSGLPVTGRTAVWDSWREVRESAETGFAKVKPPGERPDTCQ
jgi:hypothetical protein